MNAAIDIPNWIVAACELFGGLGVGLIIWGRNDNEVKSLKKTVERLDEESRQKLLIEGRTGEKIVNLEGLGKAFVDMREEFIEHRTDNNLRLTNLEKSVAQVNRTLEGLARGVGDLASGKVTSSVVHFRESEK